MVLPASYCDGSKPRPFRNDLTLLIDQFLPAIERLSRKVCSGVLP